jgi:stage V sporulation protein R
VVYQPPATSPYYSGINPYALGFAMMSDIRRICEDPTDEDRAWFPDIAGSDWRKTLDFAMRNFKDESFIAQYLSPKLIRDFHFFAVLDDDRSDKLTISAIHDEPATATCASSWPSSTTWATANRTSRSGRSTPATTAR